MKLKIYSLQKWYALPDPDVKETIYDRNSFHPFLGIDLFSHKVLLASFITLTFQFRLLLGPTSTFNFQTLRSFWTYLGVFVLFFAFTRVSLTVLTKNYLQQHIYIPKCLNFCEQRKTKFEDIVYNRIHDSGKISWKKSHVFAYGCECSKENFPNRTTQKLRVDFFGLTDPVLSFFAIFIELFFFRFSVHYWALRGNIGKSFFL